MAILAFTQLGKIAGGPVDSQNGLNVLNDWNALNLQVSVKPVKLSRIDLEDFFDRCGGDPLIVA
jgi:hypothetical protein